MGVKILTDSGSDISQEYAKQIGVTVIPLTFRFHDQEYIDGVTMSLQEFYEHLEQEEELPKTSQITPYRYAEAFKEAVKDGDSAIYISISSGVSGCYQSALLAKQDVEGDIWILDSRQFCGSLRILVEYAARLAKEGKAAPEIFSCLKEAQKKVRIIAVFATLENLRKGGRISSTAAFFGEAFSIKPVLTITDGVVDILDKVRGMKKGFKAMREYIEADGGIDLSMPYCAAYTGTDPANINKFLEENRDLYGTAENIEISFVGTTVGTYAGAGAIATAYFVK